MPKDFLKLSTVMDVAIFLEISYLELIDIISTDKEQLYNTFSINKKDGSSREINAPKTDLKKLQKLIANELAKIYLELNHDKNYSHGFLPKRNIISNAKVHVRRNIYNIDLKDFFCSITYVRILFLLKKRFKMGHNAAAAITHLVTFRDKLPQGAPTSPILTNFICNEMDKRLGAYATVNSLKYSRYADDITFSISRIVEQGIGLVNMPIRYCEEDKTLIVKDGIKSIITESGFEINHNKTRISRTGNRKEVTGLVVNEKVNINRHYYRRIRSEIYNISKGNADFNNLDLKKIHGKIQFIKQVRGKDDVLVFKLLALLNEAGNKVMEIPDSIYMVEDYLKKRVQLVNPASVETFGFDHENGTGFYLKFDDCTYFITSNHVLDNSQSELCRIKVSQNHTSPITHFKYTEFNRDFCNDIAFIKLTDKINYYFVPSSDQIFKMDKEVMGVGYADYDYGSNYGQAASIIRTSVSNTSTFPVKDRYANYQLHSVYPQFRKGMSGGPVIDSKFEVIGMILRGKDNHPNGSDLDIMSGFISVRNIMESIRNYKQEVNIYIFDSHHNLENEIQSIIGAKIPTIVEKYCETHKFEGWFFDEEFKKECDFDSYVVKNDIILHAKWVKVDIPSDEIIGKDIKILFLKKLRNTQQLFKKIFFLIFNKF